MIVVERTGLCERRYSDQLTKLLQVETGTLWIDAVDVYPSRFSYEETEVPIDEDDGEAEEILDILLGGADD